MMKSKIRLKGNFAAEIAKKLEEARSGAVPQLIAKLAEETPKDTGEAAAGWRQEGNAIVNDVEHIENLNDGSSEQAPAYFIEKTLLSQPGVRPSGTIVRSK
jgi:hypothetical protein